MASFEINVDQIDETLEKLTEELGYWVRKGTDTKVRVKLFGKALLPDIPIAAFLAAEAVTFWWTGLLRALVGVDRIRSGGAERLPKRSGRPG